MEIRLFDRLRTQAAGGARRGLPGGRDKITLEITAPDLTAQFDDGDAARKVAESIARTIRDNGLVGLDSAGRPLPPASPSTLRRRLFREAQASRGGSKAARYRPGSHTKARSNFRKRFFAPRVAGATGGLHEPGGPDVPRGVLGVESLLLFRSVVAAHVGGGRWRVYFANVRALVDKHGSSPVGRVLRKLRLWAPQAMRQPDVQHALREVAQSIVTSSRRRLWSALARTARSVQRLGREIQA